MVALKKVQHFRVVPSRSWTSLITPSLKELIESLTHHQALCYSIPSRLLLWQDHDPRAMRTRRTSLISRTQKYFGYAKEEGWLFIDCDENLKPKKVRSEVISPIRSLLVHLPMCIPRVPVMALETRGAFISYFKVKDISLVKQAMDNLFNRAFNAGIWVLQGLPITALV